MKDRMTDTEIKAFLQDHLERSETIILEEGKEKGDILEIAKAKGIELKNNTDLAGFKTVFTFANKANSNRARLPKEKLLKSLPSMIGKPVDIDHDRRFVVGHYVDYRFKAKQDMVIAYGVFYKSNFGPEWEKAKKLFKSGKLATSYEIWCPQNKRKFLADGTYELCEMEIAGGGLMYKATPAFKDAKVLELAKKNMEEIEKDLVFASDNKYKEDDLIMATNVFKTSVEENLRKMREEQSQHSHSEVPTVARLECDHCKHQFETADQTDIKCPHCFSILDSKGSVLYPPQIIDFRLNCPKCNVSNWRIVSNQEGSSALQCMSCSKNYKVSFAKPNEEKTKLINKLQFVYLGNTSCPQCGTAINFSNVSDFDKQDLKCKKCDLSFTIDRKAIEQYKQIAQISEIVEPVQPDPQKDKEGKESSEEGRMDKEMDNKDQKEKEVKDEVTVKPIDDKVTEEKATSEAPKEENSDEAINKEAINKSSEESPDSEEGEGETDPQDSEDPATPQGEDESKEVENASEEGTEENSDEAENKPLEASIDFEVQSKKWRTLLDRAIHKIVELKKSAKLAKASIESEATEKVEKIKKDYDEKIEMYKANAKLIVERRAILGEFASDLSDKDIINEDKFERFKAQKENAELKAKLENSSVNEDVGEKNRRDPDNIRKLKEEIDSKAFKKN